MLELVHIDDSSEWVAPLKELLLRVPSYHRLIYGRQATDDDALKILRDLPPGKTHGDKFVFGVMVEEALIGCADVIRGFPDSHTAFLGLLLIDETQQRQGIGSAVYRRLEQSIASWRGVTRIRLAVVGTNSSVVPFWESCGFQRTGEKSIFSTDGVDLECIMLDKVLTEKTDG